MWGLIFHSWYPRNECSDRALSLTVRMHGSLTGVGQHHRPSWLDRLLVSIKIHRNFSIQKLTFFKPGIVAPRIFLVLIDPFFDKGIQVNPGFLDPRTDKDYLVVSFKIIKERINWCSSRMHVAWLEGQILWFAANTCNWKGMVSFMW